MASIGIDLGTTNSVLSRIELGKPKPVAILGGPIVPSVVLFDGSRVIVGSEARNLELLHPERTVRSVKRHMGTAHRFPLGDRVLSPEEVAAEILKALKEGAEQALGEAVSDVVITVPAYFDDAQRRATLRAGELAGLNVLRLLNEPTSAALCYERLGVGESDEEELILVYDLGGGTFDVSVLEVFQGVREVRATTGNSRLGGDDFDDKLVTLFLDELKTRHQLDLREDPRAMARLRRLAESAKIQLSADIRVAVREDFIAAQGGRSIHLELEVTRREFEELIEDFVESTVELSRSALSAAGVTPAQLSRICLVGGSTRIPLVRARLEREFGVTVHEEIDPDLAVGLGASIQAAMLKGEALGRVLVDVAAHSLGVRVLGEEDDGDGPPDTFAPVLRRNTVLPAVRVEEFYTVQDQQAKLVVDVFQGEMPNVSLNTPVGSFECALELAPAHSPVRIAFNYNLNGVVRVTVSQPGFASTERMVELSVPDASRKEQSPGASLSAVERRALALLGNLEGPTKQQLDALLEAFRKAGPGEREPAEDTLLDFFLDHDHGHGHGHDSAEDI